MIDAGLIISEVQTSLNDLSGELITQAEYVDAINMVGRDVARKTELWIRRHVETPNPGTAPIDPAPSSIHLPYAGTVPGDLFAPYKFLRVFTVGQDDGIREGREWSYQAVQSRASGLTPFVGNYVDIGPDAFHTTFIDANNVVTDGRTVTFPRPFDIDEVVVVDYISGTPFIMDTWIPPQPLPAVAIPDFLHDSFFYGLLARITEKLYMRGMEMYERYMTAKTNYEVQIRRDMTYTRNLRDKNSTQQTMSQIWLPE